LNKNEAIDVMVSISATDQNLEKYMERSPKLFIAERFIEFIGPSHRIKYIKMR
jgi:hypothetical protein